MYQVTSYYICCFILMHYYPIDNSILRSSIYYVQTTSSSISKIELAFFDFDLILFLDPSPRDIHVTRVNETAIQVFWSPIYYPPVERYLIYYHDKAENISEDQWSFYSTIDYSATSAVISGLNPTAIYNVRVSAEFSNTNINDPLFTSQTIRREGDLSKVHIADIYRRK